MELLQLKYFADAAQSESFSRTAKKYMVPQSNISQTIKKLEVELNTLLFERHGNKVTLNENGRILKTAVDTMLEALENAKREISDAKAELAGEIKLLVRSNRRIVTECISEFKEKYPKVNFSIHHDCADCNYNNYDIIISGQMPELKNFHQKLFIEESVRIAVANGNPLAEHDSLCMNDLKDQRFISMPKGSNLYSLLADTCYRFGFKPNIVIESDDPYYVRKYVEMGLGIAFCPMFSWKGQFGDIVKLLTIEDYPLVRDTYIYCNSQRYINNATKIFTECLERNSQKSLPTSKY